MRTTTHTVSLALGDGVHGATPGRGRGLPGGFVALDSNLGPETSALAAHGLIGIGIVYPAMGMGMYEVVGYDEEAPSGGGPAIALAVGGGIALLLLFGMPVGRRASGLLGRVGAAAPKQTPW